METLLWVLTIQLFIDVSLYRMHSSFDGNFNLVVLAIFICLPNLNNANIFLAIICTAATAFCQIKVTPMTITD